MKKRLITFAAVFALTVGTTAATAQMRNGQGNRQGQNQTQTMGQRNGNGQGQGMGRGNGGQRQFKRLGPQDGTGPNCSGNTNSTTRAGQRRRRL